MTFTQVLDHGYVAAVEHWGSDERIIEAARMSTGKGFNGWDTDAKLLAYLYRNNHATPFEMAGMVVEIKAPILVFREWHRHRTQSYNEMSARYIPLPDENYLPTVDRCLMSGGANKQAQSEMGRSLDRADATRWLNDLDELYRQIQSHYQLGLDIGIPKEIARCPLPVARYSRMRASANLRNWLGFLRLRMAPNAQWEIRQYANAVGDLVAARFPRTLALFNEELNDGG